MEACLKSPRLRSVVVGGRAEVRVFLAPKYRRAGGNWLASIWWRAKRNWIVGASAYLHGLFHRGEALVGINEAKRRHQGSPVRFT